MCVKPFYRDLLNNKKVSYDVNKLTVHYMEILLLDMYVYIRLLQILNTIRSFVNLTTNIICNKYQLSSGYIFFTTTGLTHYKQKITRLDINQ